LDFNKLVESSIRKEAFDELLALGKYYQSTGDTENMKLNDLAIKDLVKDHKKARETTITTIATKIPILVPVLEALAASTALTLPSVIEVGINLLADDSSIEVTML
jgi:hypothetical protein